VKLNIENFDSIKQELLSEENYDRSFDCSDEDEMGLNEFYHEEALEFHNERLGRTFIFQYQEKTIGFVTLAMTNIQREKLSDEQQFDIRLKHYPALLIGRLASHNDCRKQGIGTYLLKWSIGAAIKISEIVGCRYIVLQTRESKAYWYCGKGRDMNLLEIIEKKNGLDDWWFYKKINLDE
jgi:GNAT superfamily N-acetyltransferase